MDHGTNSFIVCLIEQSEYIDDDADLDLFVP